MTPENIHLNPFMYEPLLDMDIVELLDLYNRLKRLYEELNDTIDCTDKVYLKKGNTI